MVLLLLWVGLAVGISFVCSLLEAVLLSVRALLVVLVWSAPSPATGTLFLLFSLGCVMAKELPASARRLRRPRRQESVPPIPTAAVDAYFTITERGAPCFAGG